MLISIIIVGKNEGWRLTKCLEGIGRLISKNTSINFEAIYVDSKSSDDSLERARKFPYIKVFQITGVANSAIGRNIGAREAKGDIFFFIDGDMDIQNEFLINAIDDNNSLKHDYLTGHIDDYFYAINDEFIGSAPRTYSDKIPLKTEVLTMNGGLFMIKKSVWNKIGGMRNKYKRGQDLDLTIRLKRMGFQIMRISFLAANHHTVDYDNENRMWHDLLKKHSFYYALLFREHLFNLDVLKRSVRAYYTAILLLIACIGLLLTDSFIGLYLYGLLVLSRVLINTYRAKISISGYLYVCSRILYQICFDISFWFGFLFFFPKDQKMHYRAIT